MKTKQEILNSHPFLQTWIENPDDSVIRCCNEEQVLWAMDEYAKSLLPSDKEISKANKEIFKNFSIFRLIQSKSLAREAFTKSQICIKHHWIQFWIYSGYCRFIKNNFEFFYYFLSIFQANIHGKSLSSHIGNWRYKT